MRRPGLLPVCRVFFAVFERPYAADANPEQKERKIRALPSDPEQLPDSRCRVRAATEELTLYAAVAGGRGLREPLLGYGVQPRGSKLVVNKAEAQRVRAIFALYLLRGTGPC